MANLTEREQRLLDSLKAEQHANGDLQKQLSIQNRRVRVLEHRDRMFMASLCDECKRSIDMSDELESKAVQSPGCLVPLDSAEGQALLSMELKVEELTTEVQWRTYAMGETRELLGYEHGNKDTIPTILAMFKKARSMASSLEVFRRPITTMRLDELFVRFAQEEQQILALIDNDPQLRRREHRNGLVIVNASKALFDLEYEHQLFAKGIVYTRDPYKLVSMPLIKFHNEGFNEISDAVTADLTLKWNAELATIPKYDGTFIQMFGHEGEVYFSTRSVVEGMHIEQEGFDYIGAARQIAKENHPWLFDEVLKHPVTYMFELIHPDSRVITNYGDLKALQLIAISRPSKHRQGLMYGLITGWGPEQIYPELENADLNLRSKSKSISKTIMESLNADPDVPEGIVVVMHNNVEIVHRVKMKTDQYIAAHKLKYSCSFKSVVRLMLNSPNITSWDDVEAYLASMGMIDEETRATYRGHFDDYLKWASECDDIAAKVLSLVEKDAQFEGELDKSFFKRMAIKFKQHMYFGLIMQAARQDCTLSLFDAMLENPPYKGFKDDARKYNWMHIDQT